MGVVKKKLTKNRQTRFEARGEKRLKLKVGVLAPSNAMNLLFFCFAVL